ncbi:hypothetical protein L7F22_030676 [Adiantum nelumboides]|nr:hypothetical protein [Adiantum nelumboides]
MMQIEGEQPELERLLYRVCVSKPGSAEVEATLVCGEARRKSKLKAAADWAVLELASESKLIGAPWGVEGKAGSKKTRQLRERHVKEGLPSGPYWAGQEASAGQPVEGPVLGCMKKEGGCCPRGAAK